MGKKLVVSSHLEDEMVSHDKGRPEDSPKDNDAPETPSQGSSLVEKVRLYAQILAALSVILKAWFF